MPMFITTNGGRKPAPYVVVPDYELLRSTDTPADTSNTADGRASAMLLARQIETGQYPTPGKKEKPQPHKRATLSIRRQ
jgi:hypothetical protein